jgi:glutaconate CoA-transferase subunit A
MTNDFPTAGTGPLFTDPSPDRTRPHFLNKPKGLTDKRMSIREAISQLVKDGDYLGIGGFGTNRVPVAAVHEILRQKKQNLGFAGHTATHDFELLCAGNLTGYGQTLARVDIAYVVGLEARGLSPHARRVLESGTVSVTEWTNYALAVRLQAAAMGVPFLPTRSLLGTDTFHYSAAKTIRCPFTNQLLCALPALYPDVSIIHVHEADIHGNARFIGPSVADLELARASQKLIITCERLIPHDEFRRNPERTAIPFFCVDAVCEIPFGGYPGNMPGEYFSDEPHLKEWMNAEKDLDQFRKFLETEIHQVPDFETYLQRRGGLKRLQQLRAKELLLPQSD